MEAPWNSFRTVSCWLASFEFFFFRESSCVCSQCLFVHEYDAKSTDSILENRVVVVALRGGDWFTRRR